MEDIVEIKYDEMSNSELRVKSFELENEYEALKVKAKDIFDRMEKLDIKYNKIKNILNKRTKGFAI